MNTGTKLLALAMTLFLVGACAAPNNAPSGRTETDINVLNMGHVNTKTEWGQGQTQPPRKLTVIPTPGMVGKKVRVVLLEPYTAGTFKGPVVTLEPGVNEIPFPEEGSGAILLEILPEPTMIAADEYSGPRTPVGEPGTVFTFLRPERLPLELEGNRVFYLEIRAASGGEALERLREMIVAFDLLVEGTDPGPLPGFVQEAQLATWEVDDAGGDFFMTVMKPGTRVDSFALELNGIPEYATLDSGASIGTLGDWQIIDVTLAESEIEVPIPDQGFAENTWSVSLETDVGRVLDPFGAWYGIETFSE